MTNASVSYLVLIDCHNAFGVDVRLISIIKALYKSVTLNHSLPLSGWSHFGLLAAKDDKPHILLPLQPLSSINSLSLATAFNQLHDFQHSEVDLRLNENVDVNQAFKMEYISKSLESAEKQLKKVKLGITNKMVVVTSNSDDYCTEILRLLSSDRLKSNSTAYFQILDVDVRVGVDGTENELLRVQRFHQMNFDLEAEMFFKSWICLRSESFSLTFARSKLTLSGELVHLFAKPHFATSLYLTESTGCQVNVSATLLLSQIKQEFLHGVCSLILPSKTSNLSTWKTLWQYLSKVALVATSETSVFGSLIIPGKDLTFVHQKYSQDICNTVSSPRSAYFEMHENIMPNISAPLTEFGAGGTASVYE